MKVSVLVTTYNHEKFIAHAIDSILMQKTSFDYEIVIIEDCSTDSTRDIVIDFQKRYPDKIHLVLAEKNKCDNTDFAAAFQATSGQYIAWLDGDDYWTSPYKLQKQVDFLDTHPECAMCFHNVTVFYEDGSREPFNHNPVNQKEISTLDDLWPYNFIAGCSPMFRNDDVSDLPEWYYTAIWGDWPLYILYAQQGKIGYINEVMGAYRVHSGGFWSGLSEIRKLEQTIKFYESMNANLNFRYNEIIQSMITKYQVQLAVERSKVPDGPREASMAVVEIVDVCLSEPNAEQLWGRHIDLPKAGSRSEAQALDIVGWVLGRSAPVVAVEVLHDNDVIHRVPLGVHRPDLAAAFSQVPEAAQCGFRTTVNVLGTTKGLELRLQAVLQDQRRLPIGMLRLCRRWPEDADAAGTPPVSVIIPCYNQAHFLGEAIESVLSQTYPHFEIVVVDDGSTDNTLEVAARYPGVRCIQQENQGLAGARNTGIQRSNGNYMVFLDADDRLLPHALETGLEALKVHPESAFVAGHWQLIAFDGSPLPTSQPPLIKGDYYEALLQNCFISTPAAVMYRRAVFQSMGGFDTSVDACADYDLYLRITQSFPVYCHDQVVAEYRRHGANMTRNPSLMLASELTVLRRQWKYVKAKKHYMEAYKRGIKRGQVYFGAALLEEVQAYLHKRQWQQVWRGLRVLLRYYPRGPASILFSSARSGAAFDSMQYRLQELANEQEALRRKLAELQHHNQALMHQNETSKHELASLQQVVEEKTELQRRYQDLVADGDTARREVTELQQRLQQKTKRLDALTTQIDALSSRETEWQRRNQILVEERDQALSQVTTLQQTLQKLTERLDRLAAQVETLSGRETELQAMLLEAHNQLLSRDEELQSAIYNLHTTLVAAQPNGAGTRDSGRRPLLATYLGYQQLIRHIREIAQSTVPPEAIVAVLSKGDDDLLRLDGRQGWHFPQTEQGVYAGHYPADSAEAIAHLEAVRTRGAQYLLFPCTAFWWLEHYSQFKEHLESHYRQVEYQEDACLIFALGEG